MSLQHTARRHDQPIRLGNQHGYRVEGDQAFINAELSLPPYLSGGDWALELWACHSAHHDGEFDGVRVAEVALDLPTPLAPYVHHVEAHASARLPLQGQAYAMVLAVVERSSDGQRGVHDFANYSEPQRFPVPHFEGSVSYALEGSEVLLEAGAVSNPRPAGNVSGTLSLQLWALPPEEKAVGAEPFASNAAGEGYCLAAFELARVSGQYRLPAVQVRARFTPPPVGSWQVALVLCEWTEAHGYVARDRRAFALPYEQAAAEAVERAVPLQSAALAPEQPAADQKLRLVPAPAAPPLRVVEAATPAAVTAAAPAVARDRAEPPLAPARRGVSIQTGSVEELAKVKGLNTKLAKEIVKARPYGSLNDLVKVRGIGEKTLQRLKAVLTL